LEPVADTTGAAPSTEGELRPLDPAVRTVWSVSRSLVVAIVVVGVFVYDALGLFAEERLLPLGVATLLALLLGSVYAVALPRLRYRFCA
jgi:membrane protein YdbS with pleckstrin-like domain